MRYRSSALFFPGTVRKRTNFVSAGLFSGYFYPVLPGLTPA